MRKSVYRKFFEKMRVSSTRFYNSTACWEWVGSISTCKYGTLVEMGTRSAHRVSYMLFKGEIPSHLEVDHMCNFRLCVNPLHLQLLTHQDNIRRKFENMTHCPKGHEYTPENTYYGKGRGRICRKCRSANVTACRRRKAQLRQNFHTVE